MKLSNKAYDVLRFIQFILPLIGTLYFALAEIWGFPYGEQIVATLTAITAFVGGLLKWSSYNYYKLEDAPEEAEGEDSSVEE